MARNENWLELDRIVGWHVCEDLESSKRKAIRKRHPNHRWCIPMSQIVKLTEAESGEYARRHMELHGRLEEVTQAHFRDTPIPKKVKWKPRPGWSYTPFTYQFLDWSGATYCAEIVIVKQYISAVLLRKLQELLVGEFRDWLINVRGSDDFDFGPQYEIFVFSDEVILPEATAHALKIPNSL